MYKQYLLITAKSSYLNKHLDETPRRRDETARRRDETARRDGKSSWEQDLCLALKKFKVVWFKAILGARK